MEIAAFTIALLAIGLSLFSFYWTSMRRPRYTCADIHNVTLIEGKYSLIGFWLTITNKGAVVGVIDYVSVTLKRDTDREGQAEFEASWEGYDIISKSADFLAKRPDQHIHAFSVEPGSSVRKFIWFRTKDQDFNFIHGDYDLRVRLDSAEKRRSRTVLRWQFRVVKDLKDRDSRYGARFSRSKMVEVP